MAPPQPLVLHEKKDVDSTSISGTAQYNAPPLLDVMDLNKQFKKHGHMCLKGFVLFRIRLVL
jgi:hypothetical protein